MRLLSLLCVTSVLLAACGGGATPSDKSADVSPSASTNVEIGCPDDGPRFPVSGKCVGRAINFLDNPAMGDDPQIAFFNSMTGRDDCHWELMEMAMYEESMLYQGMVCGTNKSTLEFASGAQTSEVYLASSAVGPNLGNMDSPIVRIFTANQEDPVSTVRYWGRAGVDDPAEAENCDVREAQVDGWPPGALVVDNQAAADAHNPEDGPRAACGMYGLNEDETNYWLLSGGYGWFFMLGQEPVGIAPQSFTMMRPDANGEWSRAE